MCTLTDVMNALGLAGSYQEETIQPYFEDVVDFITGAGVKPASVSAALVARGVTDLWNYGSGEGKLSEYFKMRVTQLAYK